MVITMAKMMTAPITVSVALLSPLPPLSLLSLRALSVGLAAGCIAVAVAVAVAEPVAVTVGLSAGFAVGYMVG